MSNNRARFYESELDELVDCIVLKWDKDSLCKLDRITLCALCVSEFLMAF